MGGARRVSMARHIINAGAKLGLDVNLFSYELTDEVPIAEVATVIKGARWSDPDLMSDLHEAVETNRIDILLPFVDPAIEVAARYVESSLAMAWTPCKKNIKIVETMSNKIAADWLFRQNGFPLPPNPQHENVDGPIIAKPCFGSASKGIRILMPEEYREFVTTDESKNFLFQKYIEHRKEYSVDCYVDSNGMVICTVPRLRLAVAGGEVTDTITVRDAEIEQLSVKIIKQLAITGAITLQFLREVNDDGTLGPALLMEINPRMGGGAVCSIHAGADIPQFMFFDYLGKPMQPCNTWREGTRICRYQQEVVFFR